MSSSRDFGFITLRSMQAYQLNGARVPPNYLLAVSSGGAAIFTDDVYISSITASTIDVSTLYARIIDVSTLNASTINVNTLNASTINVSTLRASSIITDYLTVNSTANTAFLTVTNPANDTITSTIFSVNANSADTFLVSNKVDGSRNYMDVTINNNQDDAFGSDIKFIKSHPGNTNSTTVTGDELGYVSFWGTDATGDRARASYIIAKQFDDADNTTVPGSIQFYTTSTSQSDVLRMNITPDDITVVRRLNVIAGANDTASGASPPGYMCEFRRAASSGTVTTDYQVANSGVEFGNETWQDARFVYNNTTTPIANQVWGIATSSITTSLVAPTIGDIRFYNDVYLNKTLHAGLIKYASTSIYPNPSKIIQFDAGGPEYIYMNHGTSTNSLDLMGGVSIVGDRTSGGDLYLNASTSANGFTYNNIYMNNPTTIEINVSTSRNGLTLYNSNTSQLNQSDAASGIAFSMATQNGIYTWYNTASTSGTGEGLIKDHLQLYSYFPNPQSILDIAPTGLISTTNSLYVDGSITAAGPINITNLIVDNNATIGGNTTIGYPDNYQSPYELDVLGATHISSVNSSNIVYNTPGTFTTKIPEGITSINFEMVGAGGGDNSPYFTNGGGGGYIKGTITVTAGETLTIKVGAAGNARNFSPAGASYIGTNTDLFVLAGAGGTMGENFDINAGQFVSIQGGAGGGGLLNFNNISGTKWVANGTDGATATGTSPAFSGNGGGGGGSTTGGTAGIAAGLSPNGPGQVGSNPAGVSDVSGGAGQYNAPGGNGYAGGGSSGNGTFNEYGGGQQEVGLDTGGGGGGSSYYDSAFTALDASVQGDGILPSYLSGYGRSGQGGYVSISFVNDTALVCEGDIKMGIDTGGPGAKYYVRGRNTASATIWYVGNFNTVSLSLLPAGEPTTIGPIVPAGFVYPSYMSAIGITLGPYSYATFTSTTPANSYSINNPTVKPVYIGFPFPASFTPNFAYNSTDTYLLIGNIKA